MKFAVESVSPFLYFVLCTVVGAKGYGRRVAGPFGNEAAAAKWIEEMANIPFAFLTPKEVI